MKAEYDFSNARPNPYAEYFNTKVELSINNDIVEYFKKCSTEYEIPYETLISLYLRQAMEEKTQLSSLN